MSWNCPTTLQKLAASYNILAALSKHYPFGHVALVLLFLYFELLAIQNRSNTWSNQYIMFRHLLYAN